MINLVALHCYTLMYECVLLKQSISDSTKVVISESCLSGGDGERTTKTLNKGRTVEFFILSEMLYCSKKKALDAFEEESDTFNWKSDK